MDKKYTCPQCHYYATAYGNRLYCPHCRSWSDVPLEGLRTKAVIKESHVDDTLVKKDTTQKPSVTKEALEVISIPESVLRKYLYNLDYIYNLSDYSKIAKVELFSDGVHFEIGLCLPITGTWIEDSAYRQAITITENEMLRLIHRIRFPSFWGSFFKIASWATPGWGQKIHKAEIFQDNVVFTIGEDPNPYKAILKPSY